MNKIIRTFSLILSILLFSLTLNETVFGQDSNIDTVYVISEKYTVEYLQRKKAREDIANGYVRIFRGGWFGVSREVNNLASKYGFNFMTNGCVPVEGREYYNDEVIKYLNKMYGDGWWEKFLKEESELEKSNIPPLPTKND